MAQDIEEFLRMAAARKKQQAQQGGGQPASPPNPAPPRPPSQPPSQQRPARLAQQAEPDIYIGDEDSYDHPNLEPRIKSTLSTQDIAEHASHLGGMVHDRQDAVESRVNQKFDHDLGSLQKKDITAPEVVDHGKGVESLPGLAGIIRQLHNPDSLKQALILKEIFERPKF